MWINTNSWIDVADDIPPPEQIVTIARGQEGNELLLSFGYFTEYSEFMDVSIIFRPQQVNDVLFWQSLPTVPVWVEE